MLYLINGIMLHLIEIYLSFDIIYMYRYTNLSIHLVLIFINMSSNFKIGLITKNFAIQEIENSVTSSIRCHSVILDHVYLFIF